MATFHSVVRRDDNVATFCTKQCDFKLWVGVVVMAKSDDRITPTDEIAYFQTIRGLKVHFSIFLFDLKRTQRFDEIAVGDGSDDSDGKNLSRILVEFFDGSLSISYSSQYGLRMRQQGFSGGGQDYISTLAFKKRCAQSIFQ